MIAGTCGAPAQQTGAPTATAQPAARARPAGGKLYFLDHSLQKAVQDVTVRRLAEFERLFPSTTIEHDDATPDNSTRTRPAATPEAPSTCACSRPPGTSDSLRRVAGLVLASCLPLARLGRS